MRFPTLYVRKTFEPDRLRSILVASPNWLGDAVLALPALANLRRSFPSARISLLVRPWLSPLFRSLPCIDELVELPGRGELKWAATALRQRDFELALLLPNSFRIALISRLAGIPHRVGYATDWRDSLLTVGVRPSIGTPLHQADSYLGLLRALQWDAWLRPTGFLRPPGSDAEVEKLLTESDLPAHAPVVGITPGATYGTAKRWPVERFAEVADRLADRFGTVALLFGSSSEASLTRAIRSRMRGAVIDFGGRTTLAELAGCLVGARCSLRTIRDPCIWPPHWESRAWPCSARRIPIAQVPSAPAIRFFTIRRRVVRVATATALSTIDVCRGWMWREWWPRRRSFSLDHTLLLMRAFGWCRRCFWIGTVPSMRR